jgi:hypothetical protein
MAAKPEERYVDAYEKYEDAADLITQLAEVVMSLGLGERFAIQWAPRQIKEYDRNGNVIGNAWGVYLVDKKPDQPLPDRLSFKPRLPEKKTANPKSAPSQRRVNTLYEAFGESKTLNQWAKVAGVSWPTLNARIKAGMTMEEAITDIALKNAS